MIDTILQVKKIKLRNLNYYELKSGIFYGKVDSNSTFVRLNDNAPMSWSTPTINLLDLNELKLVTSPIPRSPGDVSDDGYYELENNSQVILHYRRDREKTT